MVICMGQQKGTISSERALSAQLPISQPSIPTMVSPSYSSYNLSPAPESHLGHLSVRVLPSYPSQLVLDILIPI